MIKNYFKTALRNLWKNKVFSTINIMGLALGLACSLLIMLWVNDEYHTDAFHANSQQLYSIYEKQNHNGNWSAFYGSPGVMADEMKRVLPDVQYATEYAWNELKTFEANNKIIKESGNHTGPDFFKMFSYPLLAGSADNTLKSPDEIAISKKMAVEFFGSPAKAIGQPIRYENKTIFKVTAVFDELPKNSTAQFDYVLSWKEFLATNSWAAEWGNNGPSCFIQLRKGTNPKAFEASIVRFLDKYNKDQDKNSYIRLGIARYSDVYLHGGFDKNANISGGRIQYVQLFSVVAIFILLIACINFMNLTTARSVKRAREIGVRKVVGALRFALIRQFMGEAMFVTAIAVCLSLLLVELVLPAFNQLTGKQIYIPFNQLPFWLVIAALLLVTGFIAGSYPALYLSSFKPVKVLKGLPKFSNSSVYFRKGLVVFQFTLSIILIVSTVVVRQQVNYIQTANLGFDRGNLLYLPLEGDLLTKYHLFKERALSMPGITSITRMVDEPTSIDNGTGGVQWVGKDANDRTEFTETAAGYDFVKTMHLQLAEGRDFSKDYATDSVGYLINQSALQEIGYKNPIGKPLTFWEKKGTIIGVLKDFHFTSMHEKIRPIVIRLGEDLPFGEVMVKTEPGKTKEALANLEAINKELNPRFPFTYKFADDEYAHLYTSEQVISQLAKYFAFLGIFISCLGLSGLVMFAAEQRTKEFGIRKVLGASAAGLFGLLSKEFVALVLIAILIGSPLAWLAMNTWLKNYAYPIDISWWMFIIAGGLAVIIALLTVSFQAIRAAMANPVKALKNE